MRTMTASEANRQFSSLLREVAQGHTFVITSRGKPVATIAPNRDSSPAQGLARKALLNRLQAQTPAGQRNWTRDELYER